MGKRLASLGNEVTIFTSAFEHCERETFRSGMRILRNGGKYSVYQRARDYAKLHLSEFDVIVDEINTVPFRIPKVVKNKPVVALIHQLAREVWFSETRFPMSVLGYFALEPLWLRGYRQVPTITVSDSTKNDLIERGFEEVYTVYNGIGTVPLDELPDKPKNPILAFVGRLVKSKRPDHAILAFKDVKREFPDAELWILGDGYMRPKLESLSLDGVTFFGRVNETKKYELLRKASLLLVPSVREGWGVSVIEANAMGTPAVGYDVHGLRDSIVQRVTGLRVEPNAPALAKASIDILRDSSLSRDLSVNALSWSRKFNWDRSAETFNSVLEGSFEAWSNRR